MKSWKTLSGVLFVTLLVVVFTTGWTPRNSGLQGVWNILQRKDFVDLTHTFRPGIPHWPGFSDSERELLYWYDDQPPGPGTLGTGFYAQSFTHVGQWGTHADPPAHFIRGLRTLDEITPKEMILPLVVFDVHEKVE